MYIVFKKSNNKIKPIKKTIKKVDKKTPSQSVLNPIKLGIMILVSKYWDKKTIIDRYGLNR